MVLIPTFNRENIRVLLAYKTKVYIKYTGRSAEFERFVDWDMEDLAYPALLDSANYTRVYSPIQMKKNQDFLNKLLG